MVLEIPRIFNIELLAEITALLTIDFEAEEITPEIESTKLLSDRIITTM